MIARTENGGPDQVQKACRTVLDDPAQRRQVILRRICVGESSQNCTAQVSPLLPDLVRPQEAVLLPMAYLALGRSRERGHFPDREGIPATPEIRVRSRVPKERESIRVNIRIKTFFHSRPDVGVVCGKGAQKIRGPSLTCWGIGKEASLCFREIGRSVCLCESRDRSPEPNRKLWPVVEAVDDFAAEDVSATIHPNSWAVRASDGTPRHRDRIADPDIRMSCFHAVESGAE